MARRLIRFRTVDKHIFEDIRRGKKKIETRAASERYKKVVSGDTLIFRCGDKKLERKVKEVKFFKTPAGLFGHFSFKLIRPDLKTEKEAIEAYNSFPGYREKIKKFGIVAFKL